MFAECNLQAIGPDATSFSDGKHQKQIIVTLISGFDSRCVVFVDEWQT